MAAAPAEPSRSALAMSSSEVLDIPRGRSLVNASLKGVNREEKCVIWRGIVSRAATAAAVLKLILYFVRRPVCPRHLGCRNENFACETHTTHTLSGPPSTRAAIAMVGGVADTACSYTGRYNVIGGWRGKELTFPLT